MSSSKKARYRPRAALGVAAALLVSAPLQAQSRCAPPGPVPTLPDTISPAATAVIRQFYARRAAAPAPVAPTSLAQWDARRAAMEAFVAKSPSIVPSLGVTVAPTALGGVPALAVAPHAADRKRVLLYVHGGAFTLFSARSTLTLAALMAARSGLIVYSLDYTVAPHAQWRQITDQTITAYQALIAKGFAPRDIGLFGDSAGGSIVAGSVLKLRDRGVAMPGAVVLLSPWADLTDSGDTYCTLAAADPLLSVEGGLPSAAAYAPVAEQKNPYVSPVYGDFSKGFPPTLIQGGTREIFLSNFVRQYQAIRQGGGDAVLDLYEGMPHDFQTLAAGSPESEAALARAARFWAAHLGERPATRR